MARLPEFYIKLYADTPDDELLLQLSIAQNMARQFADKNALVANGWEGTALHLQWVWDARAKKTDEIM
jgi:hypothetical protein